MTTLVDTGGEAVERYVYDPYGKVTMYDDDWSDTRSASSYDNPILYCGYYRDSETGLDCVRHRYYHPTLGRWLSRDPIGYLGGLNVQEYVHSRPVVWGDPYGLQSGVYDPDWPWANPSLLFGDPEDVHDYEVDMLMRELRAAALAARHLLGWTYASDLLEHGLNGGGPITYGADTKFASDVAVALREQAACAFEDSLWKAVDRLDPPLHCDRMAPVCFKFDITGVEFKKGELQAATRRPDSIRCEGLAVVVQRCDQPIGGCCDHYEYSGGMSCLLKHRYDFHKRPPRFGALKDYLLQLAWRAQEAGRLKEFALQVAFSVRDLQGELPCQKEPDAYEFSYD